MAGVMSMPVAWRTTRANAATTRPGPHATSSTVSSGPAPLASTISLSAASSRMPGAVANGIAWRVNWSRISFWCSEGLLVGMPALHDDFQIVLDLEHAEVPEGVAGDDQVRILARLDGADPVRHAEERGVHLGGRQQYLHRLHHLRLQLELDRSLHHHVAQEIGARADLTAGAVGVGQALHGLLAGQVDLLDLMVADAIALALAIDHLVGDHGRHQEGAGVLDRLRGGLADEIAVLDRAHAGLDRVADGRVGVGVGQDVLADRA